MRTLSPVTFTNMVNCDEVAVKFGSVVTWDEQSQRDVYFVPPHNLSSHVSVCLTFNSSGNIYPPMVMFSGDHQDRVRSNCHLLKCVRIDDECRSYTVNFCYSVI